MQNYIWGVKHTQKISSLRWRHRMLLLFLLLTFAHLTSCSVPDVMIFDTKALRMNEVIGNKCAHFL